MELSSTAIVLEAPGRLAIRRLGLDEPADGDVVVDTEWSGVSTGTERLLWAGTMPSFPGMGYPLVPGYESVGRVRMAGSASKHEVGARVFVPGASCYGPVRGLFGGAASRIVVAGHRIVPLPDSLAEEGVLLALAATACHALSAPGSEPPDLIVGHGVLGRLLARVAIARGATAPVVWEKHADRRDSGGQYRVIDPASDDCRSYRSIYDVSGDAAVLNSLIARLAPGGEIVLAGFYRCPLSFDFAPAFSREARLRVAAEWQPDDLREVSDLVDTGKLELGGLITHREGFSRAEHAYRTAFDDASCVKMVLDWRDCA